MKPSRCTQVPRKCAACFGSLSHLFLVPLSLNVSHIFFSIFKQILSDVSFSHRIEKMEKDVSKQRDLVKLKKKKDFGGALVFLSGFLWMVYRPLICSY